MLTFQVKISIFTIIWIANIKAGEFKAGGWLSG